MGITFGVGASTFALVFYIKALEDGQIDASERGFMHIVYAVLRIGMALIALSLLSSGAIALFADRGATVLASPIYLMEWTLIGVIIGNAMLMSFHAMPMRFGPVLAGGSWYALFLAAALPLFDITYPTLLFLYGAFLIFFFFVFTSARNHFTRPGAR